MQFPIAFAPTPPQSLGRLDRLSHRHRPSVRGREFAFGAAALVLALGVLAAGAQDAQVNDQSGSTPPTPAPAAPGVAGTAGNSATAQTANPNTTPTSATARGQRGGNGGAGTTGAPGGAGGQGGSATATVQNNAGGAATATATGGNGGTGGTGTVGGAGGAGGAATAQVSGTTRNANATATAGLGGSAGAGTGQPNSAAGSGGNAAANLDVTDSGTDVSAEATGGQAAAPGTAGTGGSASISAKVNATGSNPVNINLNSTGGLQGGAATTSLSGSAAGGVNLTNSTSAGGGGVGGNARTTVKFTAHNNLTINSRSVAGGTSGNPAGVGGNSTMNSYDLTSETGSIVGHTYDGGGPATNAREGRGGSGESTVKATAAGDINLSSTTGGGWGGAGGGSAHLTLDGTSANGNVDLVGQAHAGGGAAGVGAQVTGTGKGGTVEAITTTSRFDQAPKIQKRKLRGGPVKAVAQAGVNGTSAALAQSQTGAVPLGLSLLDTTWQSAAVATTAPALTDSLRETAASPMVQNQVVLGHDVHGLTGFGASYSSGADGAATTYRASAEYQVDASDLTHGAGLLIGLFNPTSLGSGFDELSFSIVANGQTIAGEDFTSLSQALPYFEDHVLRYNATSLAGGGNLDLTFDYQLTTHAPAAGFGFESVFSVPDGVAPGTFPVLVLGSLLAARYRSRRSAAGL